MDPRLTKYAISILTNTNFGIVFSTILFVISTIFLTYLTRTIPEIVSEYDQEIPDLFTKLPILRTFYRQARIQDFLPVGGRSGLTVNNDFFFRCFISPQLILQFYGYFKETIISQGFRGGPTFSRGGGGGRGCPNTNFYRNPLTCDFLEGSGRLSPPLDPHMTHLCTKISVVRLWKFCVGNSHEV